MPIWTETINLSLNPDMATTGPGNDKTSLCIPPVENILRCLLSVAAATCKYQIYGKLGY